MKIDDSNIFHNPNDASEINTLNGIFVYSVSDIEINLFWGEKEVAYVINDNDLWIESGNSLNLDGGVVLKFTSGSTLVTATGASIIQSGTGIYYTSFKDDAKKGDTNGDGSSTTPANGDWLGIYDDNTSLYYSWANILYD